MCPIDRASECLARRILKASPRFFACGLCYRARIKQVSVIIIRTDFAYHRNAQPLPVCVCVCVYESASSSSLLLSLPVLESELTWFTVTMAWHFWQTDFQRKKNNAWLSANLTVAQNKRAKDYTSSDEIRPDFLLPQTIVAFCSVFCISRNHFWFPAYFIHDRDSRRFTNV